MTAQSLNFPTSIARVLQNAYVVSIPTKTDFRGISRREALLFEGPAGWSEFSPFIEYGAAEASRWLKAAIEGAYQEWPVAFRNRVAINATLPRIEPKEVAAFLNNFAGCTTIKMKINDFESDADRVEAVLDAVPNAKIRLDVNGGWTLADARKHLFNYHHRFGAVFDYIEQPCADTDDLRTLKSEIPYRIAADEAIRKDLDRDFTDFADVADIAIVKWQPLGGISAARDLTSTIGLPVVVSSALETGIGISHGVALAASLENLAGACGLGTVALLESDVSLPPLVPNNGELELKRVAPDPELLSRYAATDERRVWWENRVVDIWSDVFEHELNESGWLK